MIRFFNEKNYYFFSSIILLCYQLMCLRLMAGKRWHIRLGNLRTIHKDGNGAVPRGNEVPASLWGFMGVREESTH